MSEERIIVDENVSEISLGRGERAFVYFLNMEDNISLNVTQDEDSYFELFVINRTNDVDVKIDFTGERCVSNVAGVYNIDGDDKIQMNFWVNHIKPHCRSNVNLRGIAKGKSKSNIRVMGYVAEGAVKTEAEQLHKAIVLSDDAKIVAKPELEIYNDDVKCSHGNTIGNLDKQAIFYLQSRGIEKGLATEMLIDGFLDEAVRSVTKNEIREKILDLVNNKRG